MRHLRRSQSGSALIWTLCVITILSAIAAELLQVMSSKYQNALHTATWQEALLAAESGVDVAIVELRKSLYPAPNNAWDGWTVVDSEASPTPGPSPSTTPFARHGIKVVPNAGLSGTDMTVDVNVDAPLQLRDPSNSWQYYRIRSIGTMPLVGPARAADNKQDTRLRRLSLRVERFAGTTFAPSAFEHPQVSRRIEAIVRPVSAFDQAIMSVGALDLTDQNIIIDSYDSRDTTKSTPDPKGPDGIANTSDDGTGPGLYDPAKRQSNGDIATDGKIINAGNAHVYGDVATNAGTVSGISNITGVERDDFYQEPIPVAAPNWPAVNPSPMNVNGNASLAASNTESSAASRYVLSGITLSGSQTLTFTGNADGSTSYIEIYVTGDVTTTGTSQVVLAPGVRATIYFSGNLKIAGNGIINRNNQPGDLLFYGITPPSGTSRSVEIGGNSQLSAAVYAPDYDVQINNGGTRGSVYGSFVGKTVKMNGVTDLHYDEALGAGGAVNNYKIVSWFEDNR